MNTAASFPTGLRNVGIASADVFPIESALMTAGQTLIARIGGDNGRWIRVLRDDELGLLTGVVGMDTVTPVRFHMDRVTVATMVLAFPADDAGAVRPLDDDAALLVEQMAERLARAATVRWEKVPEPTGDEIVDRDSRGYWRLLARTALGL